MGWVEAHGNGHRGRIQIAGERLATSTYPTKTAARDALRELERKINSVEWEDPMAGEVLFADWVDEWRATRGGVAKSTRAADEGRLREHLIPEFGDLLLSEIDALHVRKWVSELGAKRSPRTVRHAHGLLHSVLELAYDAGRIRKNPCKGTRLPRIGRRDHVLLTAHDASVFLSCFTDDDARALVDTIAGTGTRWGEASGLRVKRVDVRKRMVYVREVIDATGGGLSFKGMPKTSAGWRSIDITHSLAETLKPLVVGRDPEDLVFVTRDCAGTCAHCKKARKAAAVDGLSPEAAAEKLRLVHAFRNRNFRRDHWDPALEAAAKRGMTLRPTPHDLRHTHVSLLIDAGVDLTNIQRRVGHSSIAVTSDVYGYLMPSGAAKIVAALERALPSSRGRTLDDELAALLPADSNDSNDSN
jgi:integrase